MPLHSAGARKWLERRHRAKAYQEWRSLWSARPPRAFRLERPQMRVPPKAAEDAALQTLREDWSAAIVRKHIKNGEAFEVRGIPALSDSKGQQTWHKASSKIVPHVDPVDFEAVDCFHLRWRGSTFKPGR